MTTTTSTTSTSTASTTSTSTSTASLGQSVLTSLNAGSGIDTASLITNLTAAQKASLEDPITAAQTKNSAQISAVAGLASDMTQFQTALATLISGGTLTTQPTTSDASIVGVALSSTTSGSIGNVSATVQVTQLAQAQTIESSAYKSTDTLAAGSLTLTVNSTATKITLSNSSNSVSDLATAINAQKATTGVTASVATDSSGNQRLVLKGATGAASAVTVQSDDYAALNFDPANASTTATASAMGQDQAAQDAIMKVDGVTYQRASNTVTDVIPGITMTLAKADTVTIGSQRPTTAIAAAISDFVSAYNTLLSDINTTTAAATSSTDAGALRGDATVRSMMQQLKTLTTTKLVASGSISTLAELGVSTQRDGTLTVDTTTLNKMVSAYPDEVERMFNPIQSSTNSAIKIASTVGTVASGTYSVANVTSATDSSAATGTIDGLPFSATGNVATADSTSAAAGLKLYLDNDLSNASATLSVDLGLSGALSLITTALTGTNGTLTGLTKRLTAQTTTLADQMTAAEAKVTVYNDRLTTQFSAMNTRVSSYKATQSYLTQQVDLWTKSTS